MVRQECLVICKLVEKGAVSRLVSGNAETAKDSDFVMMMVI